MKKKFIFVILLVFSLFMFACAKQNKEDTKKDVTKTSEVTETKDPTKDITKTIEETESELVEALNKLEYTYDSDKRYNAQRRLRESSFLTKVTDFLNGLSSNLVLEYNEDGKNLAFSPISIYLVLALANVTTDEEVSNEICTALGMNQDELKQITDLVYSLIMENYEENFLGKKKLCDKFDVVNSIWCDSDVNCNSDVLKELADNYYCQAYKVPFAKNNKVANEEVTKYIKEKTNNLIDQNFNLDITTVYALINVIYLKSMWDNDGEPLETIKGTFTNYDNTSKEIDLLNGTYLPGKAQYEETYSFFKQRFNSGFQITFIVPNEGVSLNSVYTKEVLDNVINYNYKFQDDELMEEYYTKCIFPSFKAESDNDLKELLITKYNIKKLFTGFTSKLTNAFAYCASVKHVAKLELDEIGVEAAAVTVMEMCGESAPIYKKLYEEFNVNRAFGYVITDPNGIVLFNGICNKAF